MVTESDRWFHIRQERKRDQQKLVRNIVRHRKQRKERVTVLKTDAKMTLSEWYIDEHGNLCRVLIGE